MNIRLHKALKSCLIAVLIFQLTGCGTLLYPERRGQRAGRLDVGVVVLDAIGLFFFLIPGVIAFAVDFSNGSIYLPSSTMSQLIKIPFDPKKTDLAGIEKIIRSETGQDVRLNQQPIEVTRLGSYEEMNARFARTKPLAFSNRLAYIR